MSFNFLMLRVPYVSRMNPVGQCCITPVTYHWSRLVFVLLFWLMAASIFICEHVQSTPLTNFTARIVFFCFLRKEICGSTLGEPLESNPITVAPTLSVRRWDGPFSSSKTRHNLLSQQVISGKARWSASWANIPSSSEARSTAHAWINHPWRQHSHPQVPASLE